MLTFALESVGRFIILVISRSGYTGVLLLMAVESACIPLPSEIIMPFAGYLAFMGQFTVMKAALAGTLGCNLGSIVAYYIGARGGRPLVERYGRYVLLTRHDLELADRWFARHGDWAVGLARVLPLVRTFIALPAGVARMNFVRFNICTFLGSLPWCLGLTWAGYKLGQRWGVLRSYFHRVDDGMAAILLLAAAGFLWSRWKNRLPAA
jgi:membrane protein DedA with SNARE-associated domain